MYLKEGDSIAIVATARKLSREQLTPAITALESWGLKVILGPYLFEEENQYAGTDTQRAEALQWAIDHPDIKAVLCARGGYGTMRLMDKINFHPLQKNQKLICGFSDITMLHSALTNLHLPSIHSTMPVSWPENTPEAIDSLRSTLFGMPPAYWVQAHSLNRPGTAEGKLVGGNLSLLYALTGTKYQLDTAGKILFLEDLDEYLYHIDRMILNLKLSGLLDHLAGLVVGGFTDMRDNDIPFGKTAEKIIRDAVKEFNYPVCFGFPAGHVADNRALLLNSNYKLQVNETGTKLTRIT